MPSSTGNPFPHIQFYHLLSSRSQKCQSRRTLSTSCSWRGQLGTWAHHLRENILYAPSNGHPIQLPPSMLPWPLHRAVHSGCSWFVQGCSDCAIVKGLHHLPSGKLLPLPVPKCPWSHLRVDFITDLPSSDGNTCVLVVIDWFSMSCQLLPLKGLPTAMETTEIMFNNIFRYYRIPEDIVLDRGPQFISRVWRAFLLLCVTISLLSEYHPQYNGQTERKIQEVWHFLRTFSHGH